MGVLARRAGNDSNAARRTPRPLRGHIAHRQPVRHAGRAAPRPGSRRRPAARGHRCTGPGRNSVARGQEQGGSRRPIEDSLHVMFSSRLDADLSPGRLQRALDRLRASGAPLVDLTRSTPPQCGLGPLPEALTRALDVPRIAEYSPDPCGMLSARQAVARYYADRGLPTKPEAVFLSASTSQTYAELMKLFANPGDDILVPQPSYPLFEMLITLEGCRLRRFPSYGSAEGGWRIDEQALERAFTSRTRAVILVNPNNPTGAYLAPDQFSRIQRLCASKGCPVVLDEVFYDYPAEGFAAP